MSLNSRGEKGPPNNSVRKGSPLPMGRRRRRPWWGVRQQSNSRSEGRAGAEHAEEQPDKDAAGSNGVGLNGVPCNGRCCTHEADERANDENGYAEPDWNMRISRAAAESASCKHPCEDKDGRVSHEHQLEGQRLVLLEPGQGPEKVGRGTKAEHRIQSE